MLKLGRPHIPEHPAGCLHCSGSSSGYRRQVGRQIGPRCQTSKRGALSSPSPSMEPLHHPLKKTGKKKKITHNQITCDKNFLFMLLSPQSLWNPIVIKCSIFELSWLRNNPILQCSYLNSLAKEAVLEINTVPGFNTLKSSYLKKNTWSPQMAKREYSGTAQVNLTLVWNVPRAFRHRGRGLAREKICIWRSPIRAKQMDFRA